MTFIDYAAREINCKIAYYGPGLGGKVENLRFLYEHANPSARGKLISLPTETDRTLFFDFRPLELGNVRGFKTRFHLYSVPGQSFYDASRKLILKGVDGVVFVADSRSERMEANVECLRCLQENLADQGYDIGWMPYVLQLNKRNSPTAMPVEEMVAVLRIGDEPVLQAIADSEEGIGVFDTLKAVAKLVLEELTKTDGGRVQGPYVRPVPSPARPAVRTALSVDAPRPSSSPSPRPIARPETAAVPPFEPRFVAPGPPPAHSPPSIARTEGDLPSRFELQLVRGPRLPAADLTPILLCLVLFLAGTSLFLKPESFEFLAVNLGYFLLGVAGAFGLHLGNERRMFV
jgi:hypothetical protein